MNEIRFSKAERAILQPDKEVAKFGFDTFAYFEQRANEVCVTQTGA